MEKKNQNLLDWMFEPTPALAIVALCWIRIMLILILAPVILVAVGFVVMFLEWIWMLIGMIF
jgi:hypothetical protein